jgi:hypothetical protein
MYLVVVMEAGFCSALKTIGDRPRVIVLGNACFVCVDDGRCDR